MKFKPMPPPAATPPLPPGTDPSRRTDHVPGTAFERAPEVTRLIIQGPVLSDPEGRAPLTATLRDLQTNMGFTFVAELADYLREREIDITAAYRDYRLARHYLIEVRTAEMHRVIANLYRRFADSSGDDYIDVIEPEYTLSVSSSTSLPAISSSVPGTFFSLYTSGAAHYAYLQDLNISAARAAGVYGSGVKVAVIDTGVDANTKVADYVDLIQPNGPPVDNHGHGTAMTEIIADVAPAAAIYSLRASNLGDIGVWDLMAAVKTAVYHFGADIINLSLGCKYLNLSCPQCGGGSNRSTVCEDYLDQIARNAAANGPDPIIVAAVGNDGVGSGFEWPAQYSSVVAVGAVSHSGTRSSFSNIGTKKAQTHYCLCPGGDEDPTTGNVTEWVGEATSGGATNYCIGTSPATAYASAVLALIWQSYPQMGSASVLARASATARKTMPNYNANEHGMGRLIWT